MSGIEQCVTRTAREMKIAFWVYLSHALQKKAGFFIKSHTISPLHRDLGMAFSICQPQRICQSLRICQPEPVEG